VYGREAYSQVYHPGSIGRHIAQVYHPGTMVGRGSMRLMSSYHGWEGSMRLRSPYHGPKVGMRRRRVSSHGPKVGMRRREALRILEEKQRGAERPSQDLRREEESLKGGSGPWGRREGG